MNTKPANQFVQLEIQDGIAVVTMNRPEALNALNFQLLSELELVLGEIKVMFPTKVRGLIITGIGEKSFVAGADIKEISQLNSDSGKTFAARGQKIFREIERLPLPVIAAVNGFAFGGGLELALSCDFIYASQKAKVGLPEVGLGLIPGFGGTVRLSRVVGLNVAREMILTGDPVSAELAHSFRLFNKVVEPAQLLEEAKKTLTSVKAKGPFAIAAAKKTILETFDQDLETALATEASAFGKLFSTSEPGEGTKAFLEKRKAQF